MQHRRQRFPTVRMVSDLGNGEVWAKITNLCSCASTVILKRYEFIGDSRWVPVEIACITAGKTVRMQQELCAPRRTLFGPPPPRLRHWRGCGLGEESRLPVRSRLLCRWGPLHDEPGTRLRILRQ